MSACLLYICNAIITGVDHVIEGSTPAIAQPFDLLLYYLKCFQSNILGFLCHHLIKAAGDIQPNKEQRPEERIKN